MAGGIKGIIVKIGGDTTELGKSLTSIQKQTTELQKELKGVNTLLKMDPKNVTLLTQKQDILNESIEETKSKLKNLKEIQRQVDSKEIEMSAEDYRNLQREIEATEIKLQGLVDEQKNFGSVTAQSIAASGEKLKDMGASVESAGRAIMPVSLAMTGLGTAAVKVAADFEKSMSNVQALSGATGEELEQLSAKAQEMGQTTKFSATESADAFSYMALAGWDTKAMLDGIEPVLNLAAAADMDLATASDIVTDNLTAFGLTAQDAAHFTDVMAYAMANSNTSATELGEAYKNVAATAASLGYSVEDTTAVLMTMADAGIKGGESGTALNAIMTRLATDTKGCATALKEYGVEVYDANGNMNDLQSILEGLKGAWSGLTQEEQANIAKTLAGTSHYSALQTVMNGLNDETIAAGKSFFDYTEALETADGAAKEMSDVMQDNLLGRITTLKSNLEGLAISIGNLLIPFVEAVVEKLSKFVTWLNSLDDGQKKIIVTLGLLIAAAGPVLVVVGKLMQSVGTIMTFAPKIQSAFTALSGALGGLSAPIVAIVAVIGALVAAFMTLWNTNEEFRNSIIEKWQELRDTFQEFTQGIVDKLNELGFNFESIGDVISAAWNTLCSFLAPVFEGVWNQIVNILTTAMGIISGIVDILVGIFTGDWEQVWSGVEQVFESCWNGIKGTFESWWIAIKGVLDVILGWFGTDWDSLWSGVRSKFESCWNDIKSFFSGILDGIKNLASSAFEYVRSSIEQKVNMVKNVVTNVWNAIKNTTQTQFNAIKSIASTVFNAVKTAMTQPIETAKNTISNVINSIKNTVKNIFNGIKPKLNLSLPKVHVSGGKAPWGIGGKGELPSFSVTWNKRAMDNPYLFTSPTIFGMGNTLQGAGEAGAEIMYGRDNLMRDIKLSVDTSNEVVASAINNLDARIMNVLSTYLPELANRQIVLDSGEMVGALAGGINQELGSMYKMEKR